MIDFELDTSELDELMRELMATDKKLKEHSADVLDWVGRQFTVIMQNIVKQIEFRGDLRESIGYEVAQDKKSVDIGPNIPSGDEPARKIWTVHDGRPEAHYVPPKNLFVWADARFGDPDIAFYISKRIAGEIDGRPGGVSMATRERRTPDFPFTDMALDSPDGKAVVVEAAERLAERLVATLEGSR